MDLKMILCFLKAWAKIVRLYLKTVIISFLIDPINVNIQELVIAISLVFLAIKKRQTFLWQGRVLNLFVVGLYNIPPLLVIL